ncbi:extracellular solute-binding protein [Haloferax namakaokahaiae]|uniref:Extracellular solute-binding protein n=1 Tax=Haloferax namakaokahaiae TaxID=1748331 RepID=A0ABD5ZHA3_9EURY
MEYDRRTILKQLAGTTAVGALAGCVGVSETDSTQTPDESGESGDEGGDETTAQEQTEAAGPSGTFTLWHQRAEAEKKALESSAEAFTEQTDHTAEPAEIADLRQKTTSAIPAGQGAGMFDWAHDWTGEYYQNGFLSDQSGNLDVDLSVYTQPAQAAVQFDDATLALPYAAETVGLIYNEELVDEAPETIADMKAIMEEHHDPENGKYGLSYPLNAYFMSAWAHAFGGYYFDESNVELGLSNDATLEGFQFILDNFVPYQPKDTGYDPQAAVFLEGNAPFAINGPWFLGDVKSNGIDAGVTRLPSPEGEAEPKPYTTVKQLYFTNTLDDDEAKAAAARAFAEWYTTNTDVLSANAEDFGYIPVYEELASEGDLPPAVQGFSESVALGTPIPSHPKMGDVWGPLEDAFNSVKNGDAEIAPAFEKAEQDIRSNWE